MSGTAPLMTSTLRYVPLGGLGEVGMNMWALEWEDQVLVVDAGLTATMR
jgi:ribonuclease J